MIDTALVLFAKYPEPGKVKTRLKQGRVPPLGVLDDEQCASLYRAFLLDYVRRLRGTDDVLGVTPFFCLRPGASIETFQESFGQGAIEVIEEPTFEGQRASDIGEAMSFTIRHFLGAGFRRVLILGTDLPHLPLSVLTEARALLLKHPLVIGDDGGGCYLVGASAPPVVLEGGLIRWSQGEDFQAIQRAQAERGETVGLLSEVLQDVDTADDLVRFVDMLRAQEALRREVTETVAVLERWGVL
ncbi:MAG: hypothetical protein CL920_31820 [Deltaproteobacteria bacterium]|nr:hypothetical protein [Deltaproteobacteria bacterium]MBU53308.1 hypothetical protein [Deltaproteobacteria bacterium]|tara:strand:- start:15960 stop:16688 length:729 start_codon:yes stop_codon:yes gene_type:complete